jgi:hypothetical protein
LQSIVPPDRVCISFHQLEEPLDDCFLERIAGRAAVGIRCKGGGTPVKEIQQAGRKMFEAPVAQGPQLDLGPFDDSYVRDLQRQPAQAIIEPRDRQTRAVPSSSIRARPVWKKVGGSRQNDLRVLS